jgi:hydroxyacylglutathione hydrolase
MGTGVDFKQPDLPDHPGWRPLSVVPGMTDPFFANVLFLPGFEFSSNIYAVGGDGLSIIDTGNDYTAFLDLFRLGHKPADIGKIILTHGHRDHAMGVFDLLRLYPGILEGGGVELILHEACPRELKEFGRHAGARVTEVRGGETLPISGQRWDVLHTPGHTVDGICLVHPPSRTACTGDTVLPHAMAEPDTNAGGRLDHYLVGIKTLLGRDVAHVLPGHGSPVASSGRKVVEETYEGLMMKIIGVDAKRKIPWIEGATGLAQRGCLEEAVYCCEKELLFDPECRRAHQLKAVCLNDLGRFHEALDALETLAGPDPGVETDLFTLLGKGYALLGIGRYRDSLHCFDEALKVRPGSKDARIYRGMALYLSGRYDEAMEIEPFRTEFAGRFREELERRTKRSDRPDGGTR